MLPNQHGGFTVSISAPPRPRLPTASFIWLSLTGIAVPPRNPNNNNDEDGEDEDEDEDEEDDKREPAVIREPDEDE
jgi:hypothetical protein